MPDESTILRFRRLIEEHDLARAIFAEIGALLEKRGLLLKRGTIVGATIISAPSSTKNATQTRDPEMKQTRKGNAWYHGMKVKSVRTSAAWCTVLSRLMRLRPTAM